MKRFVFILMALTCTMFAAIASADVGTDRGTPLQTCTLSAQLVFISPAIVFPVAAFTPVVCIALDKQYTQISFLARVEKPDPFRFIDPGNCIQVSDCKKFNIEHFLYYLPIRSTARHV